MKSFSFNDVDMFERYGVRIRDNGFAEDNLIPNLRARKATIPNRSGAYDYGAKYYDERELTIKCVVLGLSDNYKLIKLLREIAYDLSSKGRIKLWYEPDKYYVGRLYNAIPIGIVRNIGAEFDLKFVCEPFLYGDTIVKQFSGGTIDLNYKGTANTPTRIEIINNGNTPIRGISITLTNRKDNY